MERIKGIEKMNNTRKVIVAIADESSEARFLEDFNKIQAENKRFLKGETSLKNVEDICNDISHYSVNNPSDVAGMLRISRCCAESSLLMLRRVEVRVKNIQQIVEINLEALKR